MVRKLPFLLLAALVAISGLFDVAKAATPTPTRTAATTTTPAPTPSSTVPLVAPPASLPEPEYGSVPNPKFVPPYDITLKSLGYPDTAALGILVAVDFYFPGAGGYPLADGNYLVLYYAHSEVLLPHRSTMAVEFNGLPVADVRLTADNVNRTEMKINLRRDKVLDTVNHVRIYFYMRMVEGDCIDEYNNPALNSTVFGDSYLHYEYASLIRKAEWLPPDLSDYPAPFTHPPYPWPDEIYFVLPDRPSTTELTMAASMAAKLGQLSRAKRITTTLVPVSRLTDAMVEDYNLIFVGKAESLALPRPVKEAVRLEIIEAADGTAQVALGGQPIPADHGILQEAISPWNPLRMVLLVTGINDLAVKRAGTMLTGKTYIGSLVGSRAIITMDPGPPNETEAVELGPNAIREATLEQMGMADIVVYRSGERPTTTIAFASPPPNPKELAYADLIISHSPLVGRSSSSLRIELNGIPIHSEALHDGNAKPTKIRVDLPSIVLKPGYNTLTFRYTLHWEGDLECEPIDWSRGWAIVHAESLIHLPPAGPTPPLSLALFYFPYLTAGPFLEAAYMHHNVLVLPTNPNEWWDALTVAVLMGRRATTDVVALPAMLDRDVDEAARKGHHLILYGTWSSNSVLKGSGVTPPLQFLSDTGKTFSLEEDEIMGVKDEVPLGMVEVVSSPWNRELALMIVSGRNLESMSWASQALDRSGLTGNLATVAQKTRVTTFNLTVAGLPAPAEPPAVTASVAGTASVAFLIVACLALILLEPRLKREPRTEETGEEGSGPNV